MRKSVLFSVLLACVLFYACKDQSMFTTPDSSLSTPSLAAQQILQSDIQLTVKIDGQPEKVMQIKPQLWDGHSKLESGKAYVFQSTNEMRAAFLGNNEMQEFIDGFSGPNNGKIKEVGSTSLASFSASAWCTWHSPGPPGGWESAHATTSHTNESGSTKKHEFIVRDAQADITLWTDYANFGTSSSSGSSNWDWNQGGSEGTCASGQDWAVYGKVYKNDILQAFDQGGCYCDRYEHSP